MTSFINAAKEEKREKGKKKGKKGKKEKKEKMENKAKAYSWTKRVSVIFSSRQSLGL